MDGVEPALPGWVVTAAHQATTTMLEYAEAVGLENTEKSTFRAFFMASAHLMLNDPVLRTDWRTDWRAFDLLAQDDADATLVQFEYYLHRQDDLDGAPRAATSGAGPENEAEFAASLGKLRDSEAPGVTARHLVLLYQREPALPGSRSYDDSYDQLAPSATVARVWRFFVGPLAVRVFDVIPASVPAPGSTSMASLRDEGTAPLLWYGEDATGEDFADEDPTGLGIGNRYDVE